MKPVVAIVGRPNVGKSTLFNRVSRSRRAVVEKIPGVTRDRLITEAEWAGWRFTLIDTGGFEPSGRGDVEGQVREQIELAIDEADVVIALYDARRGYNEDDRTAFAHLRRKAKAIVHAVNKIDGPRDEVLLHEFYSLGAETLTGISAAHGRGIGELLDRVAGLLPRASAESAPDIEARIAVVGRPNVGKSTLLNRLVGQPRHIVADRPGTTRDAVDSPLRYKGKSYLFIDTAGIRRKAKISERLERYCVVRALKSIDRCDVALVVIDAMEEMTSQDARIVSLAAEHGRATVVIVNKWDAIVKDEKTVARAEEAIAERLGDLRYAPVLTISAETGQRVSRIMPLVESVARAHRHRITPARLSRILDEALAEDAPRGLRGRGVRIRSAKQVATRPPRIVITCDRPDRIEASRRRYLANRLRSAEPLTGTPLRLEFRQWQRARKRA